MRDWRAGDKAVLIYVPYQMAAWYGDFYLGRACTLLTDFSGGVVGKDIPDGNAVELCKVQFSGLLDEIDGLCIGVNGPVFYASREMIGKPPAHGTKKSYWRRLFGLESL